MAFDTAVAHTAGWLEQSAKLNARYRAGEMRAHVPDALHESDLPLEELVAQHLPTSHAAFAAASRGPGWSVSSHGV